MELFWVKYGDTYLYNIRMSNFIYATALKLIVIKCGLDSKSLIQIKMYLVKNLILWTLFFY